MRNFSSEGKQNFKVHILRVNIWSRTKNCTGRQTTRSNHVFITLYSNQNILNLRPSPGDLRVPEAGEEGQEGKDRMREADSVQNRKSLPILAYFITNYDILYSTNFDKKLHFIWVTFQKILKSEIRYKIYKDHNPQMI